MGGDAAAAPTGHYAYDACEQICMPQTPAHTLKRIPVGLAACCPQGSTRYSKVASHAPSEALSDPDRPEGNEIANQLLDYAGSFDEPPDEDECGSRPESGANTDGDADQDEFFSLRMMRNVVARKREQGLSL
eukprot:6452344-Prymnesium_polylepis.1